MEEDLVRVGFWVVYISLQLYRLSTMLVFLGMLELVR